MPQYPLDTSASATIGAAGTASVTIGPKVARESWDTTAVTVTSTVGGVSASSIAVSQYGQVVDSTANDPRPTVTTDTPYHIPSGGSITVAWAGMAVGTGVTVKIQGTRTSGGR